MKSGLKHVASLLFLSHRPWTKVVSVERDHYYWNTTLPSFTICPTMKRIDRHSFEEYCDRNKISGSDKDEFNVFIESMANVTYESLHLINAPKSIEVYLDKKGKNKNGYSLNKCYCSFKQKLNIKPEDYMMLIFNLTRDQLRDPIEWRVRSIRNQEFINSEQVLTEHGICYVSNSFIAKNLSAKYTQVSSQIIII